MKTVINRPAALSILKSLLAAAVSALLAASLAGCSTGGGARNFVRPDYNLSAIKKIAVLPFESLAFQDEYAGERIRRVVITELLIHGYEVVEPGEVTRELAEIKKFTRALTTDDIKKIGKNLGVDAIMTGAVEAYRLSSGLTVQYPDIALSMRLLDAESALVVWSIVHSSGGPGFGPRHFGTEGPSLGSTAHSLVRESVDALARSRGD